MKKILVSVLSVVIIFTGCSKVDNDAHDSLVEQGYVNEDSKSQERSYDSQDDALGYDYNEIEYLLNDIPELRDMINDIISSDNTGLTTEDIEDILTNPIKSREDKQYQELLNSIDSMLKELEDNCNDIINKSRK